MLYLIMISSQSAKLKILPPLNGSINMWELLGISLYGTPTTMWPDIMKHEINAAGNHPLIQERAHLGK